MKEIHSLSASSWWTQRGAAPSSTLHRHWDSNAAVLGHSDSVWETKQASDSGPKSESWVENISWRVCSAPAPEPGTGDMEKRTEGCIPGEPLEEKAEERNLLFSSPFPNSTVRYDSCLLLCCPWPGPLQGATEARSWSWRKGQRNKVQIQRECVK